MTISDIPTQLTCPHCGGVKYILSITSGNTCRGEVWSDLMCYYPMLRRPSFIQRCPHCSRYYYYRAGHPCHAPIKRRMPREDFVGGLYDDLDGIAEPQKKSYIEILEEKTDEEIRKKARRNQFGDLDYKEVAEAEEDVMNTSPSEKKKQEFWLYYIHAYNNAKYGRTNIQEEVIAEAYQVRFRQYAERLITSIGDKSIVAADLYREQGEFEKSMESCRYLMDNDIDANIAYQIYRRARIKDPDVFQLRLDKEYDVADYDQPELFDPTKHE